MIKNVGNLVADISNEFEKNKSNFKKNYIIKNIMAYKKAVETIESCKGIFGTGYPFYALGTHLSGELPLIDEQIRYNEELRKTALETKLDIWTCEACLNRNKDNMPDLKQICKTCPKIDDKLKPRKVINRLPDIDMWMICKDELIYDASKTLTDIFNKLEWQPSDIDPVATIYNLQRIVEDLKNMTMPTMMLPIDTHIIGYNSLKEKIIQLPYELNNSITHNNIPYIPIHPLSYRKTWQFDDVAYNFVHDFLSSLTEYSFDEELQKILSTTRNLIAYTYSIDELYEILIKTGPESVKRRHENKRLRKCFEERIESWKK